MTLIVSLSHPPLPLASLLRHFITNLTVGFFFNCCQPWVHLWLCKEKGLDQLIVCCLMATRVRFLNPSLRDTFFRTHYTAMIKRLCVMALALFTLECCVAYPQTTLAVWQEHKNVFFRPFLSTDTFRRHGPAPAYYIISDCSRCPSFPSNGLCLLCTPSFLPHWIQFTPIVSLMQFIPLDAVTNWWRPFRKRPTVFSTFFILKWKVRSRLFCAAKRLQCASGRPRNLYSTQTDMAMW